MGMVDRARADEGTNRAEFFRRSAPATALMTALAYAAAGLLALLLAGPPGYASPLYPAAGIALAAVLTCGRAALPGVLLGAFAVNASLGAMRGQTGLSALALSALIGFGAALQAAAGAWLVRRHVAQPVVLNAPRDILRFGLLGALVACTVSPSIATPALLAAGAIGIEGWVGNWLTWWVGDTLGVLIAAPLVLTLIGKPQADWRPRRRTLGIPMLLALALLAVGMVEFSRLDRQRLMATFERDADRLAAEAQSRLATPLQALQALQASARSHPGLNREALQETARWWLSQPIPIQAMGYTERVALDHLDAFEAAARGSGDTGYKVVDRDDGQARRADGEVLAIRYVMPAEGNQAALGVNALSLPETRAAVLITRDSAEPATTVGFALRHGDLVETGLVINQALYSGPVADEATRRALFRGTVFVGVRTERALAGLVRPGQEYLQWCLVDPDPRASRPRLAGPAGCELPHAAGSAFQSLRILELGHRALELRLSAAPESVPGRQPEPAWLLSMAGLAAATLLGTLLLTVTGHSRQTELAVQAGTAELRREMVERNLAEGALRESEARLRSILDNVPLGIVFLDPDGRVLELNPRLCEMTARQADELRRLSMADLVAPEETVSVRALQQTLVDRHAATAVERLRLRTPDGREIQVRLTIGALRDGQGRLLRMVGVLEDITEHLRLEASEHALHRVEAASRAKSDFLSRMSHELRTPLNAMIGFAQLLGLDRLPGLAPHQREWAQQIQRAGWHLLELINETLDLARIESGAVQLNLAPVALGPLVAACHGMLDTAAGQLRIRMVAALAPDAEAVFGDATRMKQILTNLLSNAVKYNREGGSVSLSSRRVVTAQGDRVEIAVADTGLGMTAEQMSSLFQPYNRLGRETSGIEGTGIGLVISRRLAELMGGTLEATSQAGIGTVFVLQVPAAVRAEAPDAGGTDGAPAPYQQRLVHYVEDNETNIEVMRGIFAQRPQIRLETSVLGLDGLSAIRARRPDLILLDMQLPDISGLELLRHLKQDDLVGDIPVVVVSADATPLHVEQALTSGALHYLTKPLDVAVFLGTVDGILESIETHWGL
jgi:PAS domain S-box-containing protein